MTDARNEREAVTAVAKAYYEAAVHGDEAGLRRVFEPRASIIGNFESEFQWEGLDEFVKEAAQLVGSHGVHESRVERVDIVGDTAVALVGGRYIGLWFEDFLAMVKIDGHWRIVAKTFRVKPGA